MLFLFLCRGRCWALNLPLQPPSQMHNILALCRPCTGFVPQTARAKTRRCRCRWKKTKPKGQSQTSTATTASSPSTTIITNSATIRAAIATRGKITGKPMKQYFLQSSANVQGRKKSKEADMMFKGKIKSEKTRTVLLPKCKLLPKACKRNSFSSKQLLVQCR